MRKSYFHIVKKNNNIIFFNLKSVKKKYWKMYEKKNIITKYKEKHIKRIVIKIE